MAHIGGHFGVFYVTFRNVVDAGEALTVAR